MAGSSSKIISGGDTVQKVGISTKLSASIARSPDVQEKVLANADYVAQMEIDELFIEHEEIVEQEEDSAAGALASEGVFSDIDMLDISGLLQTGDDATNLQYFEENQSLVEDDQADDEVSANKLIPAEAQVKKTEAVVEVTVDVGEGLQQQQAQQVQDQQGMLQALTPCEAVDAGSVINTEDITGGAGTTYFYSNGYYAHRYFHFGQSPDYAEVYDPTGQYIGVCDHWVPGG